MGPRHICTARSHAIIEHNKLVAEPLSKLLAESYTLYLKTHKYLWNVTGPMFHSLHVLFEQQLAVAEDHRTVASDRIEIHEKAAWMLSAHLD